MDTYITASLNPRIKWSTLYIKHTGSAQQTIAAGSIWDLFIEYINYYTTASVENIQINMYILMHVFIRAYTPNLRKKVIFYL